VGWLGTLLGTLGGFVAGASSGWFVQRSGSVRAARAHLFLDLVPEFERAVSECRDAAEKQPQSGDEPRRLFSRFDREAITTSAADSRKVYRASLATSVWSIAP
jgi:hypothetical protein